MRYLRTLMFTAAAVCVAGCGQAEQDVRPTAVAGQFYPGGAQELQGMVDGFLANVPEQTVSGGVKAILVPHAGYVYSGQTAAYAFMLLKGAPVSTVVIIGNSHHFALDKGAVYTHGAFNTPLGDVKVNEALARRILAASPLLEQNDRAHAPEHSIEVELPFLQRTLGSFTVVPILMKGECGLSDCKSVGEAVASAIKGMGIEKSTLIVESSDMSHYPSWANANMNDSGALKALERFDPPLLQETIKGYMSAGTPNLVCVFCGEESLFTTMYAAKALGARNVQVLHYTNSGDVTNDRSRVVGYSAVAFTSPGEPKTYARITKRQEASMNNNEFSVTPKNQKVLLAMARRSIEQYLKTGKLQKLSVTDPELVKPGAVFVTLTKAGDLRGCIGTTEAHGPLYEAVNQLAVAAAVEDHRFSAVTLAELPTLHIEISVLSPMQRVRSAQEIQMPKHGVVVRRGFRSGLFLPQVWEHFSTKDDFLSELCEQKAGLDRDAWKDPDTELYVFTVFAFEEKQP